MTEARLMKLSSTTMSCSYIEYIIYFCVKVKDELCFKVLTPMHVHMIWSLFGKWVGIHKDEHSTSSSRVV